MVAEASGLINRKFARVEQLFLHEVLSLSYKPNVKVAKVELLKSYRSGRLALP